MKEASCRCLRRFRLLKAVQEIGSPLRVRGGGENRALIRLQHVEPVIEVARWSSRSSGVRRFGNLWGKFSAVWVMAGAPNWLTGPVGYSLPAERPRIGAWQERH